MSILFDEIEEDDDQDFYPTLPNDFDEEEEEFDDPNGFYDP